MAGLYADAAPFGTAHSIFGFLPGKLAMMEEVAHALEESCARLRAEAEDFKVQLSALVLDNLNVANQLKVSCPALLDIPMTLTRLLLGMPLSNR